MSTVYKVSKAASNFAAKTTYFTLHEYKKSVAYTVELLPMSNGFIPRFTDLFEFQGIYMSCNH